MTLRNDDEDYWNSSDKKVVTSFDEDEVRIHYVYSADALFLTYVYS
jgi:hypothetical protein